MAEVSDLVLDSRLDTRFHEKYVYHVYHESDSVSGQRAVRRREFWQRRRHLGSGGFGSVWLEQCVKGQQEGSMRAVKEIQRPRNQFECNRELEAIAKFSHDRYARCFAKSFGWYEQGSTFYLAMEYFPLGDLQSYLGEIVEPLPEAEVQQITFQILEGLKFMHDNGFAHRDIKPANILVQSRPPQEWWIKISDFGISKRFRDSQGISTTIKGTLAFMAPELHGIHPGGEKQSIIPNATDMWALGEIMHQLLTKRPVFDNVGALYHFVLATQSFPKDKLRHYNASESAVSFIQLTMAPSPKSRMTAEQALQHPWLEALRPAPSPDLPELDLPEAPDILADLDLDEPSARWTTLGSTGPSTSDQEQTIKPSATDNHQKVIEPIHGTLVDDPSASLSSLKRSTSATRRVKDEPPAEKKIPGMNENSGKNAISRSISIKVVGDKEESQNQLPSPDNQLPTSVSNVLGEHPAVSDHKHENVDVVGAPHLRWTLCSGNCWWDYFGSNVLDSNTYLSPKVAFADPRSWTELFANYICKEALVEQKYPFNVSNKSRGQGWKFGHCFVVMRALSYSQVLDLAIRTIEIKRGGSELKSTESENVNASNVPNRPTKTSIHRDYGRKSEDPPRSLSSSLPEEEEAEVLPKDERPKEKDASQIRWTLYNVNRYWQYRGSECVDTDSKITPDVAFHSPHGWKTEILTPFACKEALEERKFKYTLQRVYDSEERCSKIQYMIAGCLSFTQVQDIAKRTSELLQEPSTASVPSASVPSKLAIVNKKADQGRIKTSILAPDQKLEHPNSDPDSKASQHTAASALTIQSSLVNPKKRWEELAKVQHMKDEPQLLNACENVGSPGGVWDLDEKYAIAGFTPFEGNARIGDLGIAQEWTSLKTYPDLTSLALDAENDRIVFAHNKGEFSIWDMSWDTGGHFSCSHQGTYRPEVFVEEPICEIAFVLSGSAILLIWEKLPPRIWHLKSQTWEKVLPEPMESSDRASPFDLWAVSFSGKILAIRIEEKTIALIDISHRRKLANSPSVPNLAPSRHGDLAFSRDDNVLAYATGTSIVVWEYMKDRVLGEFGTKNDTYDDLALSSDGKILAAVCNRHEIHFWKIDNGMRKVLVSNHYQFLDVKKLLFTPNDMLIGVGSDGPRKTRNYGIYEFPTPIIAGKIVARQFAQPSGASTNLANRKPAPEEAKRKIKFPKQAIVDENREESSLMATPRSQALRISGSAPTTDPYTRQYLYKKQIIKIFSLENEHKFDRSAPRAFSPFGEVYFESVQDSTSIYDMNGSYHANPPFKTSTGTAGKILKEFKWLRMQKPPLLPDSVALSSRSIFCADPWGRLTEWNFNKEFQQIVSAGETVDVSNAIGISWDGSLFAYVLNGNVVVHGDRLLNTKIKPILPMTLFISNSDTSVEHAPEDSDPQRGNIIHPANPLSRGHLDSIAFSQDSRLLAMAITWRKRQFNNDITSYSLRIYNIETDKLHAQISYFSVIERLVFSPNGKLFAFQAERSVYLWDVVHKRVHMECLHRFSPLLHKYPGPDFLAFSHDSRLLAVITGGNPDFDIWDSVTGKVHNIQVEERGGRPVELDGPCSFRRNGSLVAFASGLKDQSFRAAVELVTLADIEEILSNMSASFILRGGYTSGYIKVGGKLWAK